jgi:RNA-binding protein
MVHYNMSTTPLTGAQRTRLRGFGQKLPAALHVGRDGATPSVIAQLDLELVRRGLVKIRFTGGQDRHERAALHNVFATATLSECVGAVGHTALFWRSGTEGSKLLPELDETG